ncbi:MAG: hypothetical protein AAGN35_14490 [Bacteroidota bacterium]
MKHFTWLLLLFVLFGCGGASPEINGKWNVHSVIGDGREMSAPGDWLHFQDDKIALVRLGGMEEKGTWRLEPDKKSLLVQGANGGETRYECQFNGDSLYLKAFLDGGHTVRIVSSRAPTGNANAE